MNKLCMTALGVVMILLCIPAASFAKETIIIGGESITLPDLKGYHLHVKQKPSVLFSKVKDCAGICGPAANGIVAMYLSDAYDAGKKIENCLEIDLLSIVDTGMIMQPGANRSAVLEGLMMQANPAEISKKMAAGMEQCTNALSKSAGGIFKFKSAEIVESSRGDNYAFFIVKSQIEKRVGNDWKPLTNYDATANIILKGRLLTINASDTHRQTTPEAAREIALRLINALNEVNK